MRVDQLLRLSSEVRRVLRPGGVLAATVPHSRPMMEAGRQVVRRGVGSSITAPLRLLVAIA